MPLFPKKTFGTLIFLNKLECIIDITLFWTFGVKEDLKMEVYRGEFGFGGGFGFLMSGIILAISFIICIQCCYKMLYRIRSKVTFRLTRILCYIIRLSTVKSSYFIMYLRLVHHQVKPLIFKIVQCP